MKHTEHSIQLLIQSRFIHGRYLVPNLHLPLGEVDLLLIRQSGYAEEFEIKLTNRDFKADTKKHAKHYWYKEVNTVISTRVDEAILRWKIPNRFSYVCPESIGIYEHDVPVYTGLYHVMPQGRLVCIKHPPRIHKIKYPNWDRVVAASCSPRYMALRTKQTYLKAEIQRLRTELQTHFGNKDE